MVVGVWHNETTETKKQTGVTDQVAYLCLGSSSLESWQRGRPISWCESVGGLRG